MFSQTSLWFTGYVCFCSQATGTEAEPPLPSAVKMKVRGTVPLKPPYVLECTSQLGTEKNSTASFTRNYLCGSLELWNRKLLGDNLLAE